MSNEPRRCEVMHGSLLEDWTADLAIPQEFDRWGQCTGHATQEFKERGNDWSPICTKHASVMRDHSENDVDVFDVQFRRITYVIDEEEHLDDMVEFLFAKATQMAQQSPNYVPKDKRQIETPNIDALLKKNLKDALRKK